MSVLSRDEASMPAPAEIAAVLERRVIGQPEAVREVAVALAKKLAGLHVGNVLMIGSSGSGKTTLMRAVETFLAERPALASRSTVVRVHANVLAEEAMAGRHGEALLHRLLERAREELGDDADFEVILDRATHGMVFVDEVDKIRSRIDGRPNTDGIRAQEALLTLIENESVPLRLPDWAGGGRIRVDSRDLLFICGGAFEGLYDAVYDRVTIGENRGALQSVTTVEDGVVEEFQSFSLRDWLRSQDLFTYGMTPQFLARFDAVVLLQDLGIEELVRIFLEAPDSALRQAREYFTSRGIELAVSPAAVRRIAREAAAEPRMGARALKEVFRRVVRDFEFDPSKVEGNRALMIDLPEVEAALNSSAGRTDVST